MGTVVRGNGGARDAESMLVEGRAMYERGDRMNGFKTFERALDGGGDGTMTAATRETGQRARFVRWLPFALSRGRGTFRDTPRNEKKKGTDRFRPFSASNRVRVPS